MLVDFFFFFFIATKVLLVISSSEIMKNENLDTKQADGDWRWEGNVFSRGCNLTIRIRKIFTIGLLVADLFSLKLMHFFIVFVAFLTYTRHWHGARFKPVLRVASTSAETSECALMIPPVN